MQVNNWLNCKASNNNKWHFELLMLVLITWEHLFAPDFFFFWYLGYPLLWNLMALLSCVSLNAPDPALSRVPAFFTSVISWTSSSHSEDPSFPFFLDFTDISLDFSHFSSFSTLFFLNVYSKICLLVSTSFQCFWSLWQLFYPSVSVFKIVWWKDSRNFSLNPSLLFLLPNAEIHTLPVLKCNSFGLVSILLFTHCILPICHWFSVRYSLPLAPISKCLLCVMCSTAVYLHSMS